MLKQGWSWSKSGHGKTRMKLNFDVSFDLRLNKRLSKQSEGWWLETPSRPLWFHCNGLNELHRFDRNRCKQTITLMLCEIFARLIDALMECNKFNILRFEITKFFSSHCLTWWREICYFESLGYKLFLLSQQCVVIKSCTLSLIIHQTCWQGFKQIPNFVGLDLARYLTILADEFHRLNRVGCS